MFKKKNCFCSKEGVDVFDRDNQLPAIEDTRLSAVINLLSSAIIRHKMRFMNKKERIINKKDEERPGLLRTIDQNGDQLFNNYNGETT
jgi:hypothetical protein